MSAPQKVRGDSYYQFYPGDYIRDTLCLSMMEDGAYRRLLDSYYCQEELPAEREELYRIARAINLEEQKAVDRVVEKYFTRDGDRLTQPRVERQIESRREFLESQSRKGKISGEIRRLNRGSNPGLTPVRTPAEPVYEPRGEPEGQPEGNLASASASASASALPSAPKRSKPSSGKDAPDIPYEEIIRYLNTKAGKNFNHRSESNRKHIRARWAEGFREMQFKMAIDNQVREWKGTDMEMYLRPTTLFNSEKFDGYVNNAQPAKTCSFDGCTRTNKLASDRSGRLLCPVHLPIY